MYMYNTNFEKLNDSKYNMGEALFIRKPKNSFLNVVYYLLNDANNKFSEIKMIKKLYVL